LEGVNISNLSKIILLICILILPGAYAIDVSFSASNGGRSVGFWETYDTDDSIGVKADTSTKFKEGLSMTESQTVSGQGDAHVYQEMFGTGGGNDYMIINELLTNNAAGLNDRSNAKLEPASSQVTRRSTLTNCNYAATDLYGIQDNGNQARAHTEIVRGSAHLTQAVSTNEGVHVNQRSTCNAYEGYSVSELWWGGLFVNHRGAHNWVWIDDGAFTYSGQGTATSNSLSLTGSSQADANGIVHGVVAGNYDWVILNNNWWFNPGFISTRSENYGPADSNSNSNAFVDKKTATSTLNSRGVDWTLAKAWSGDGTADDIVASLDPMTTAIATATQNTADAEVV